MTMDFTTEGKMKIRMKDHIKNKLEEFPLSQHVDQIIKTQAAEYLFTVRETAFQNLMKN